MDEVLKFLWKLNKELRSGLYSLFILCVIEHSREPIHGYQIIQNIKKWTGGKVDLKDATVYPTLRYLQRKKLLNGYWGEPVGGPPRKYYELTEIGKKALREGLKDWDDLVNVANEIFAKLEARK